LPFVVVVQATEEETMRYMLLMCAEESAEEQDEAPAQENPGAALDEPCWAPWARLVQGRGVVLRDGAKLQPTSAATTVRVKGGEAIVCDGPFAETKEQIVGYNVIECADLDAAIETAAAHPVAAHGGTIEVRPIMEEDG
jgi:hypothetical protein